MAMSIFGKIELSPLKKIPGLWSMSIGSVYVEILLEMTVSSKISRGKKKIVREGGREGGRERERRRKLDKRQSH